MNIISFLCYLLSWNITILFIETASHDRTEYFHDKDKMDRLRAYTNSPDGIRRRNNDIRFASKVLPPGLRSSERLHWAEDAQSKRTHSPHWYRGRTDMNSQIIPRQSPSPDNKLEKLQMRRGLLHETQNYIINNHECL